LPEGNAKRAHKTYTIKTPNYWLVGCRFVCAKVFDVILSEGFPFFKSVCVGRMDGLSATGSHITVVSPF